MDGSTKQGLKKIGEKIGDVDSALTKITDPEEELSETEFKRIVLDYIRTQYALELGKAGEQQGFNSIGELIEEVMG